MYTNSLFSSPLYCQDISEHCQNFTTAICSPEPCQECVCDISVPMPQAQDSTARPPSTASAPAGHGAPPARWCHDPARRCSTGSGTTPPVSAAPLAPASTNNRFKTRFNLIFSHPPYRVVSLWVYVFTYL